jgi:hypothetical protein
MGRQRATGLVGNDGNHLKSPLVRDHHPVEQPVNLNDSVLKNKSRMPYGLL